MNNATYKSAMATGHGVFDLAGKQGKKSFVPPMGVSQWRNHGKSYGYWEFFAKDIRSQIIEEVREIFTYFKNNLSTEQINREYDDALSELAEMEKG